MKKTGLLLILVLIIHCGCDLQYKETNPPLFAAMLKQNAASRDKPIQVKNSNGYSTLRNLIIQPAEKKLKTIIKRLTQHNQLRGSVAEFINWRNVTNIIALDNHWHLRLNKGQDMRVLHAKKALANAKFGDNIIAENLGGGGIYILLLQYKEGQRNVLLSFINNTFIIEDGKRGVGFVEISKK